MSEDTLRAALRAHTSNVHKRLDDLVGDLSSAESYRTFIARTYAFRCAVEPTVQALPNWVPLILAPALREDVSDLRCGDVHVPALQPASTRSANLGRLYVLEGSSVGARVLYSAAQKLGFTNTHGARHLALQANDIARWKQFVVLLETIEEVDRDEALFGARQLFDFALVVYS